MNIINFETFNIKKTALMKQYERIKKDLETFGAQTEDLSFNINEILQNSIEFYGLKLDSNRFFIVVEFNGGITSIDGKYTYRDFKFIRCLGHQLDSLERTVKLLNFLNNKFAENGMSMEIMNKDLRSFINDELNYSSIDPNSINNGCLKQKQG